MVATSSEVTEQEPFRKMDGGRNKGSEIDMLELISYTKLDNPQARRAQARTIYLPN